MKFNVGCKLGYSINQPSTLIFNLKVIQNDYQNILQENLQVDPQLDLEEYDLSFVENQYFRVNAPLGKLRISYNATVELTHVYADAETAQEVPPANLPLEVLPYLYPSRYCQSDMLGNMAQSEFGDLQPGFSRVTAICNWIYEKVEYLSGSTDSQTSAYDTATQRAGVCRDFAHLAIAFCRALNIPARFVAGYAYDLTPPDFHAYFEAYLSDRWYIFDATRLAPQSGLIRIGTGRDAADVAFATFFGSVQPEEMEVFAHQVFEPGVKAATFTTRAIATS